MRMREGYLSNGGWLLDFTNKYHVLAHLPVPDVGERQAGRLHDDVSRMSNVCTKFTGALGGTTSLEDACKVKHRDLAQSSYTSRTRLNIQTSLSN